MGDALSWIILQPAEFENTRSITEKILYPTASLLSLHLDVHLINSFRQNKSDNSIFEIHIPKKG